MSYEAKPGSAAHKLIEHFKKHPEAKLYSDEVARLTGAKSSDLTALMTAAYQAKMIECRKEMVAGVAGRLWSAGSALKAQLQQGQAGVQTSAPTKANSPAPASTPANAARAPAVAATVADDVASMVPCGVASMVPCGVVPRMAPAQPPAGYKAPTAVVPAPAVPRPSVVAPFTLATVLPGNAVVHDKLPRPADTPKRNENPVRDALLQLGVDQAIEFDTTEIRRFQMTAARITKAQPGLKFSTHRLSPERAATWRDA